MALMGLVRDVVVTRTFVQRCAPGTLITRDVDGALGMIVLAQRPSQREDPYSSLGWRFLILVGGVLIDTRSFARDFSLVHLAGALR